MRTTIESTTLRRRQPKFPTTDSQSSCPYAGNLPAGCTRRFRFACERPYPWRSDLSAWVYPNHARFGFATAYGVGTVETSRYGGLYLGRCRNICRSRPPQLSSRNYAASPPMFVINGSEQRRGGWFLPSCVIGGVTAPLGLWPFSDANCASRFSARCRGSKRNPHAEREATRVHQPARWRGHCMAGRGACAAARHARSWVPAL